MSGRGRVALIGALAGAALLGTLPPLADAQDFRRRRGERPAIPENAGVFPYDGRLTFARVKFEPRSAWDGWANGMPAWGHDYPFAERNFMRILSEITAARTFTGGSRVVELTDPELFKFPIAYLCEPGHWTLTEEEAAAFRAYLLKGGFVIFDDFSGYDWENFAAMMDRVLPGVEFFRMDVSHPLFHAFFEIETLDLMHPYQGRRAEFFGVYEDNDPTRRLLAIVNYNADLGDYFEYSATGWVPVDLTNEAYKLGVNYWVYALTH